MRAFRPLFLLAAIVAWSAPRRVQGGQEIANPPAAPAAQAAQTAQEKTATGKEGAAVPDSGEQQRWKELPPATRRELMAIQHRFEALPPEERERLLRQLRVMRPEERRALLQRAKKAMSVEDGIERDARRVRQEILREKLARLSPAERERLRSLPPLERRQFFEERGAQRRQTIIARLPEAERLQVEKMPPREQVKFLRRFQAERTLQRTFQDPREVDRLRHLPAAERRQILKPLRAGMPPARRPEFFSDESWRLWNELKPFEQVRVLRQLLAQK